MPARENNIPQNPDIPQNPNTPTIPEPDLAREQLNNFRLVPLSRTSSQDTITAFEESVLHTHPLGTEQEEGSYLDLQ